MTASRDGASLRVGVCGTAFGQIYLEALARHPEGFHLGGILARGSRRSQACAERYGVPLFDDLDRFARHVDVACVVVRGGLLGGRGSELAQGLMARGVHVLQEHPLHSNELAQCLRCARRHGVAYGLNSFYVHLAPVRRFLGAAHELLRLRPPLYLDAASGFQVAYALLDILAELLGKVGPWGFAGPAPPDELGLVPTSAPPFRSLEGAIGGVPLSLRVQNRLDPDDPDGHAHLLHRITVGTDAGQLTLCTTHGPILWSSRPQIPSDVRDPDSAPFAARVSLDESATCLPLGDADAPSDGTVFGELWPDAAYTALLRFRGAVVKGENPLLAGSRQLGLCRVWQDVASRLGPPELVRRERVRPLTAEELAALAHAAERAPGPRRPATAVPSA